MVRNVVDVGGGREEGRGAAVGVRSGNAVSGAGRAGWLALAACLPSDSWGGGGLWTGWCVRVCVSRALRARVGDVGLGRQVVWAGIQSLHATMQ